MKPPRFFFPLPTLPLAFSLVLALGGAASLHGQSSFAVNFTQLEGAAAMEPSEMAGEAGVIQANWNNLTTVDSTDAKGKGASSNGELLTVMDKEGKELSGVVVQAGPGPNFFSVGGASYGFTEGDKTLHDGMLRPEVDVSVQNIPYAKYDLYVYGCSAADGGNAAASCSLDKGDSAPGEIDTNTYYLQWSGNKGEYLPATSTEEANAAPGNCFVFKNMTARDVVIHYKRVKGSYNHGMAGFQIVEAK